MATLKFAGIVFGALSTLCLAAYKLKEGYEEWKTTK